MTTRHRPAAVRPPTGRSGTRLRRTLVAASLLTGSALLVACGSSDDGGSATTSTRGDAATTTGASSTGGTGSSGSTTSTVPSVTTGVGGSGGSGTDAARGAYRGSIPGADLPDGGSGGSASVRFTFTGARVEGFTVAGLRVSCLPTGAGTATTRSVDLTLPPLTVSGGSVDGGDPEGVWQPTVSGTFATDGRFAGSLTLNRTIDGRTCGGEFPFYADPPG